MSGLERVRDSRLAPGIIAAIAVLILDQASKVWLLFVFDIAHRGAVRVTPFFDLVLAWNVGISFGWFQSDSAIAQIILMAIKAVAVVVLAVWMAWSRTLLATLALGLWFPRYFSRLSVMSPSIWWDDCAIYKIVEAIDETARPPLKIWLDTGTNEPGWERARELRDRLVEKGWRKRPAKRNF